MLYNSFHFRMGFDDCFNAGGYFFHKCFKPKSYKDTTEHIIKWYGLQLNCRTVSLIKTELTFYTLQHHCMSLSLLAFVQLYTN